MDSSNGSREYTRDYSRYSRGSVRPTVRFYDLTSVARPENYTPSGLPLPIRSRSPVYNIRRSGSVPVSLTSTGSTPVTPASAASTSKTSLIEENKEAAPEIAAGGQSGLEGPSSTGLSGDIAQIRLTATETRDEIGAENDGGEPTMENIPKTSPDTTPPQQSTSPVEYADAQTFIADNAGELWSTGKENEGVDDLDMNLSQKSHVFQTSGRFNIDDSTSDSNPNSQPFPTPTQVSSGFQPNSSQSTAESSKALGLVSEDADCKTEKDRSAEETEETQPFDSQTYHSMSEQLGSSSNSNQNSNVQTGVPSNSSHDSSSGSADSTLSQHTSTTQSSSTPTRSQPSPVMPSEFESPFAAQRRNAGIITEPNSPRQGLPRVPLSPARVKRVKQENRTYTVKKIGDYVNNIYNFVETRSFENRTLHLSRESQQYREKGG